MYVAMIEGKTNTAIIAATKVLRPTVQNGTAANKLAIIVASTMCGHQELAAMDTATFNRLRPFPTGRLPDRGVGRPRLRFDFAGRSDYRLGSRLTIGRLARHDATNAES
jgi:hypothetical protein